MTRSGLNYRLLGILGCALCAGPCIYAQGSDPAPDFREVYEIIKTNLPDISESRLNAAAVHGLVSELSPKVAIVEDERSLGTNSPGLQKTEVFEKQIGYFRIARVSEQAADELRKSYDRLTSTNPLQGVVLDLRFAGGESYNGAAAVADLFLNKSVPLLNFGEGVVRSTEKSKPISVPVSVLVNRETSRAAEALAAVVREVGVGLVVGSKTAGKAFIAREFPLSTGQRIRLAGAPLQVGASSTISTEGVEPDIRVNVSPDEERAYFEDAFRIIQRTNFLAGAGFTNGPGSSLTNRIARRMRFNEAELVRERREGGAGEAELSPSRASADDVPLVTDPALARAIDLLKGLAVVRQSR